MDKHHSDSALCCFLQLDLSSMDSVKEFVREFTHKKRKLHVLINNAATFLNTRDLTRRTTHDGFELTMAINHLGLTHFHINSIYQSTLQKHNNIKMHTEFLMLDYIFC